MLKMEQGRRFYKLFNALLTYANEVLEVEPLLHDRHPLNWSAEDRAFVIDEIWENRQVIENFVQENPLGFDATDLETVLSWRYALHGVFYVKVEFGGTKFLLEDRIFEVADLARPIANMLTHAPVFVSTTLLPFDGLIVYDTSMKELSISIGSELEDMCESAFSDGCVVSTASQFEAAAAHIEETRSQRDLDELQDDIDYEESPERGAAKGMHRGALVDLTEEERAAAIDESFKLTIGSTADIVMQNLKLQCVKGAPVTAYADLLVSHKRDVLQRYAGLLGVTGASSLNKRQLAERIVEAVSDQAGMLKALIAGMELEQFRSIREIFEAGGHVVIDKENVKSSADMPVPAPLFTYAFDCGDTFELVMPDEVLELVCDFEWDAFESYLRLCECVCTVADLSVSLRGIVKLDEAYEDYRGLFGNDVNQDDFQMLLMSQHLEREDGFEFFEIDDDVFMVHYELADDCLEVNEGAHCDEGVYVGLSEEALVVVRGILREREGKSARPVSLDMLASGDLFEWALKQQPVIAMRDFLDEHVPDGDNDFFFAERMLETLCDMSHGGYRMQDVLNFLESESFFFDDDRLMQKELDLLSNLFNSLPKWDNNGWSPIELIEGTTGQKIFFNEDGSVRKVGRNDPRPCGSGKKYKKCCGR